MKAITFCLHYASCEDRLSFSGDQMSESGKTGDAVIRVI